MASDALEVARRLAPRLAARAEEYDRTGEFPVDDFADLREAGLFGLLVPSRLGGLGASFSDYVAVAYELARGNGATALVYNMHVSVTGALDAVTDELADALGLPEEALAARDRLLAAAAAGSWYAVAMSERGVGSRLSQMSTVYEPVDGGYRIKGAKSFCSGAGYADGYLVAARSAEDGSRISQFLVPATVAGLRVEPTWDSLGMRATASHDLHLDVTVPADALLGGVEGLALLVAQLMPHWMVASYAAVYVGVAQSRRWTPPSPTSPSAAWTALPAVRARIGRADAAVAAARLVVEEAARRVDAAPGDRETNRWVWRAKLIAGETAMEWRRRWWRRPARRPPAGGIRWSGSIGTPGVARCIRPTSDVCADWLGVAALGGDPDRDGVAPDGERRAGAGDRGSGGGVASGRGPGGAVAGFFARATRGPARVLAERIFANSGVRRRHAAVNPLLEDVAHGRRSAGCSATWPRRCRWARRRWGGRSRRPGSPRRRSGCSRSAPAPGT